jgi:hypothetical protein
LKNKIEQTISMLAESTNLSYKTTKEARQKLAKIGMCLVPNDFVTVSS